MRSSTAFRVVSASLSDVGRRRAANQDYCEEFADPRPGARLLVLCDGMGGHQGGETASRLAVDTIGEVFRALDDAPEVALPRALKTANERVFTTGREQPELKGMGTTAVALLLEAGGLGVVAHVGDSRAYRIRDGRAEALTKDHSLWAETLGRGELSPEEIDALPRNVLTRAIGADIEVQVDVDRFEVTVGDRFLLCSDGLWNVVADGEIALLVSTEKPEEAARHLVALANERGGPDNITVQIAVAASADGSATAEVWRGADLDAAWTRVRADAAGARLRRIRRGAAIAAAIVLLLIGALVATAVWREDAPAGLPSITTPPPRAGDSR